MTIEVRRSSFEGSGREGDFRWMIEQPQYARTLFVFNDNEQQFDEHQERLGTQHRCSAGGGNAAIRPFQCAVPPRATGIPTGRHGGYRTLADGRRAIDEAVRYLGELLATGEYDAVTFSWNAKEQSLGTGIFEVADEVKTYIVEQIVSIAAQH
jgi:hypothetical protein